MYFIDTHIHLQAYNAKTAPQIISEAAACDVRKLVCAAVTEADWQMIGGWAEKYPQAVVPAFGIHPWYLETLSNGWRGRLAEQLERFPQALIGETGLDRSRNPEPEPQAEVFRIHLELAEQFDRPLLIHAVKVWDWLEAYWPQLRERRFVIHSFNARREQLDKIIKAGGYVSFSNSIYRNRDFAALAAAVPAEKLLFETDGPFQGPEGKDSHPCQIAALCAKVAAARPEPAADLAARVYLNSLRFINV